jgi:deazaflavin-dependent oxidoreductase (nitroreductase family)
VLPIILASQELFGKSTKASLRSLENLAMTSDRNDWNSRVITEFRANGGNVAQFNGVQLLLLHHKGARSGREYLNPLAYLPVGEDVAVFASKGGSPNHPDWYYNLVANPAVRLEFGDGLVVEARARVTEGEEHDRLYAEQAKNVPVFAEYQRRTGRVIPVVILERR